MSNLPIADPFALVEPVQIPGDALPVQILDLVVTVMHEVFYPADIILDVLLLD